MGRGRRGEPHGVARGNSNAQGLSGLKLTGLTAQQGGPVQPIGVDANGNVVPAGTAIGATGNFLPISGGNLTGSLVIGSLSSYAQNNGSYLLNVAGPVRADKLTVNTTGADFVFDPSYKLRPLPELEGYVWRNRHLPGIAPAEEMQKSGVEIGESQAKLLQKIEELTLYIISQDKKVAEQEKKQEAQAMLIAGQGKLLLEMKKGLEELKNRDKQPR